eukprot:snap_masked-scaffold_3-processed-gene-20.26-mRNA-1 protein AED:0.40 eAED:0.41 QI:0/-1/0/1/-1/1/1/0/1072
MSSTVDLPYLRNLFRDAHSFKLKVSETDSLIFPFLNTSLEQVNLSTQELKEQASELDIPWSTHLTNLENRIKEEREAQRRLDHEVAIRTVGEEISTPSVCNSLTLSNLVFSETACKLFSTAMENSSLRACNVLKLFIWKSTFLFKARGNPFSFLEKNNKIRLIDLTNCNIGDEGAQLLAKSLSGNKSLRKLNLRRNQVSDAGIIALADALPNTSLFSLLLSDNRIGPRGTEKLCTVLEKNSCLSILRLSQNRVMSAGAKFIAKMICFNRSLLELDVNACILGEEGVMQVFDALRGTLPNEFDTEENKALVPQVACPIVNLRILDNNLISNDNMEKWNRNLRTYVSQSKQDQIALFDAAMKANETGPWLRSRIVFVGEGRSGKTSTVRALLREPFQEEWDSTVGASLTQLSTTSDEDQTVGWTKTHDYIWNGEPSKQMRNPRTETGAKTKIFTARHAARILAERLRKAGPKVEEASSPEDVIAQEYSKSEESDRNLGVKGPSSRFPLKLRRQRIKSMDRNLSGMVSPFRRSFRRRTLSAVSLMSEEGMTSARQSIDVDKDFMVSGIDMEAIGRPDRDTLDFSLWDLGGQSEFYSLHHLFLTSHALYVVVFNLSDFLSKNPYDFSYLSFWIESILLHASGAPVFLVGTHLDLIDEHGSQQKLADINEELVSFLKQYSSLLKERNVSIVSNDEEGFCYFPLNNRKFVGVHTLQLVIEREARLQQHVNAPVPIRWLAILDAIISKGTKYVKVDEVFAIAAKFEVKSNREVYQMLELFHELGVIVHLTSTERLRGKIVLQCDWLMKTLGKVIRDANIEAHVSKNEKLAIEKAGLAEDSELAFSKGLLSKDLIDFFWKNDKDEIDFLLDVMKETLLLSKFSADRLNTEVELYLVPSLLKPKPRLKKKISTFGFGSVAKELRFDNMCIFDFSSFLLPIGIFERLVCGLMNIDFLGEIQGLRKVEASKRKISVYQNFFEFVASTKPAEGFRLIKHLQKRQIVLYCSDSFSQAWGIVQNILQGINSGVMGHSLSWEAKFSNNAEFLPYEQARKGKIFPWFQEKTAYANTLPTDLNDFLSEI